MQKKRSFVLALMFALTFALVACGSSGGGGSANGGGDGGTDGEGGGQGDQNLELVKSGKFTFASSGAFPPFSKVNESGEMEGYDIAVGKAIAEKLGLEPNPKKYKFGGIIAGIVSGRFDAAVASHTITEKRDKKVDFSQPYYYSGPQIFTQPGSDLQTLEDLTGKEIAVSKGSTYYPMAQKVTDNIHTYASDLTALRALAKGKHDAVITDIITGKKAIAHGLKVVGKDTLGVSKQAVAVAEGNEALLKAINKALTELKEEGTLAELGKKWIGSDISQPPEKAKE
ncbi:MAG TPA: transporter substrate-binding domain-containing protein [Bacillales bacterium]|nr:transporter substrate-binding domain-containing protein [Bacillales bacterium]